MRGRGWEGDWDAGKCRYVRVEKEDTERLPPQTQARSASHQNTRGAPAGAHPQGQENMNSECRLQLSLDRTAGPAFETCSP